MKNYNIKLTFSIIICFVLLFSNVMCSYATNYSVYVYDNADLLSSEEEIALKQSYQKYAINESLDIVFLTYSDANGKSTMTYTDDFYDGLEGDYRHADNGVLFAIDMDNREIYINTVGIAISKLTDDEIDMFLDYGFEEISNEKYFECLDIMSEKALTNMFGMKYAGFWALFFQSFWISIGVSILIIVLLFLVHNKANHNSSVEIYLTENSYKVKNKNTIYLGSHDRVDYGYYKSSSSSSSGGSSHRSSSGRSHGGGGRSF